MIFWGHHLREILILGAFYNIFGFNRKSIAPTHSANESNAVAFERFVIGKVNEKQRGMKIIPRCFWRALEDSNL